MAIDPGMEIYMIKILIRPIKQENNRLNKTAFFLKDEWRQEAEAFFALLRAQGFEEVCTKPSEKCVMDSSYLVFTDDHVLAAQFAAGNIVCVGCAVGSSAFFEGVGLVVEHLMDLDLQELEEYYLRATGRPVTIARTERLILREITGEDIPVLCEISRQEGMEDAFDAQLRENFSTANLWSYIQTVYRFYGYGLWSVCERDGSVVGCCGVADVQFKAVLRNPERHSTSIQIQREGEAEQPAILEGVQKRETERPAFPEGVREGETEQPAILEGVREGEAKQISFGEEMPVEVSGLELQYMLKQSVWGQGYGTEMCRSVLGYVFARTDERKLWLRVFPGNYRSIHLAEKLGFTCVGQGAGGTLVYCFHV